MAFGIKDLVSLMDHWDVWKEMRANAERVPDLEQRITALEEKLRRAPGEACPSCGAFELRVAKSAPDPTFGRLGGARRTMKCSECGFEEEKIVT
jgi:hypothetical protein